MGGPLWVASPRDRNGLLDERCFLLRKPGDLDLLKLMLAFSFGDKGRLDKYWCLLCLIEAVGPRLSSMWLGIGPPSEKYGAAQPELRLRRALRSVLPACWARRPAEMGSAARCRVV